MAGGNTNQNPEAGIDTSVRPATIKAAMPGPGDPSNAADATTKATGSLLIRLLAGGWRNLTLYELEALAFLQQIRILCGGGLVNY
jgi:hypothetical protein